ncbi:hypothetical protein LCL61_05535 [Amycolatopsis coloradensis]|uniref:Uncharacterized protein n=1 Tax=Amycolatopsis coloradensis TaxID=76021 RepID=A0ACD5B6P8_9PSEU
MTELGAYVERFETNCRRRALRGVAAIVIGAPIAVLGVVVFMLGQEAGVSGGEMIIGLAIGCGLGLALRGAWGCWHAIGKRGGADLLAHNIFEAVGRRSA